MRKSICLLSVFLLNGCQSETPPASKPDVVEASPFSSWPSVTDKPVFVGTYLWSLCRSLSPEEAKKAEVVAKAHGPHARHSIIVRVSPEAINIFREGGPLALGAIVVKEKYLGGPEDPGRLYGYARMIKREAGYYPEGGDWEYEYVELIPERKEARGRLTNCAGCHASAKERDFVFRSYTNLGR
jgi:hypothetical protein